MKKVLLTGTAGFIGMYTTEILLKQGYEVVGLDSINDYYDINLKYGRLRRVGIEPDELEYGKMHQSKHKNLKFVWLKLEEKDQMQGLFQNQQFDYVIHLAAQAGVRYSIKAPFAYLDSNLSGFMNILEGCRLQQVKHLIFASSSSVYGKNTSVPFKESDVASHPISLYAATKKANEVLAHSYSSLYAIPSTGLRFFTVYGPWGRPDMAMFIFTQKILNGEPIEVFNNGVMRRDFTYILDIVEGIVKLLDKPPVVEEKFDLQHPDPGESFAPYRICNIGKGQPQDLLKFINAIESELGVKAKMKFLPMQQGDVPLTFADTSKLTQITNYSPTISIEEGVQKFVQWYRDYYNL